MNEGLDRSVRRRRKKCAVLPARLARASSVIDLLRSYDGLLLQSERIGCVGAAGYRQQSPRLGQMLGSPEAACDLAYGRDIFETLSPQQVTEGRSIRETGGVNALIVNSEFLMHRDQHRVKEIKIAISDRAGLVCFDLPSRLVACGIDMTRRV